MTRRMLINAQNPEELRVAIVDGERLENFQLEDSESSLSRGNVYRGVVSNIQPSLNAAFINYGGPRDGFLPFHDVVPEAYHHPSAGGRARVENVLERGGSIVVQVAKDSEGQKGAGLTTNISLAGRYLVLTPYDDSRGVSRKVEDEEIRRQLKEQAASLKVPPGCGFIVRTNALEQTKATLTRDFGAVMRLWKKIQTEAKKGKGAKLLHSDQDIVVRVLRDYLDTSIEQVLIDDEEAFEKASAYVLSYMPRGKSELIRYTERAPLFSKYGVEPQIERIFDRIVPLPSGGSIVVDRTEALVAIDVNSGKSTRAATQEQTAYNTNIEAAAEVARQLRLRDIGGLVVVDFIDMRTGKNDLNVEKALRDALKPDKARTTVGRISENGLLEINRQRIQKALHLRTHRACPTCEGTGRIASVENVGLQLLRKIESRAAGGSLERVRVQLHPELADGIQNARRQEIAALEREFGIDVEIIAATRLHRPEQEIEWFDRAVARDAEKVEAKSDEARPGKSSRRKRKGKKSAVPAEQRLIEAASEPLSWLYEPEAGEKGELEPPGIDEPDADEDSEPSAIESFIELGSPSAPADGPRSKRRRRGRRRKKGASPAQETQSATQVAVAPPLKAEPETVEGAAPVAGARAHKRRPRRRSRRRPGAGQPPPTESAPA